MEGVGARLGRSSTRCVSQTIFTGPVRKWKKKWVHALPSNPNHHAPPDNSTSSAAHLLLYKWTPITYISKIDNDDSDASNREQPLRKKFKYIPIEVIDEEKNELSEHVEDDDASPIQADPNTIEATWESDGQPDINDETIDESQAIENNPAEQHDLNESPLDLSLGLKDHKEEKKPIRKADGVKDDQHE